MKQTWKSVHPLWKKSIDLILIFCSITGLSGYSWAEEAKTLTLAQAIEIALSKNPELKQVTNNVMLSRITVNQKKANFFPSISLSTQFSQQYGKDLDNETGAYSPANSQSLGLSGTLNLNIFNGLYDLFSLQQSKLEMRASEETLTRYQQTIVFETVQSYIQVILSNNLIEVDKKNLEAQRLQLNRIEEFYKSGKRPIADLLQQMAEISRYEYLLLNTERNFRVNKILLFQILGLDPGTNHQISEPGIENLIQNILAFNRDKKVTRAMTDRPDFRAQEIQTQAAQKQIKTAYAGFWPTLSLNAQANTNYSNLIESYNFSDQFLDNHPNATIGLTLSLPVFDQNVNKNNVAKAKINLNNQQLELERLGLQISVEIQQAIEDFNTAEKQVKVAEAQERYSRAALESVEERYNVNAATMAELIQTRSLHYGSLYDLVEAKFNLLIRGMAKAFYQGDGDSMISILKIND